MSNVMPKQKATKIMKDFASNGFKKGKALIDNGYSAHTADKKPGVIIARAERIVKESLDLPDGMSTQEIAQTVLDVVGYTREDVVNLYRQVVEQERDLSTKLKALAPLLRQIGVHFDDDVKSTVIPTLNIGIIETKQGSTEPYSDYMSQNGSCATLNLPIIEGGMEGGEADEPKVS